MKILQVASGLTGWGGIEAHVIALSAELTKRGHDVSVACQPGKFVEVEARKRGLPTVPLVCRKKHDWASARSFASVYRRERPDVVHVHGGADHVVPPFMARRLGVPAVLMTRHSPKPLNAVSCYLYGTVCYHHIIAVSEYVRGVLIQSGVAPNKISTIHHGTDTEAFAPDGVGSVNESLTVGFAGRFVAEKGGDVLLRALAKCPQTVGIFFGDGVLENDWQRLAENLGVADRVAFAGFQENIAAALASIDIFVLPSVWAEPCAAVVQQAMALEKPVIGTNLGGTPEMIVPETGLLVPSGDPDALAEAITELAALTPEARAAMGKRGCERVIKYFSLSHMAHETEALYDRLLSP